MKLMIFAIDALPPDVLISNIDRFPNMKQMIQKGAFADYDAYAYGYGSRDNWISLYTGLTPQEHGTINNKYRKTGRCPYLTDYKNLDTFWKVMNSAGLSVGMWKGLATTPPEDIHGFMISGEICYEQNCSNKKCFFDYCNEMPIVTEKDKYLLKSIEKDIPQFVFPKPCEYFGCSWQDLKSKKVNIEDILTDDYFINGLDYFEKNLNSYEKNILNIHRNKEVDVCFFYTQFIDFICHFQMHDLEKKVVIKALELVDSFIGRINNTINPENIIVLSDHGIKGWYENFVGAPEDIQQEMFGLRDEAIWLKNGSIVINARIGGFLSAMHDIKGTFIACGEKIKHCQISDMRTVDFYPTLLEWLDIKVPKGRSGFVLDIFKNKDICNKDRLIPQEVKKINIGILQNIDIPTFNKIVNEVFLQNRFATITILGKGRYIDSFLSNSRVDEFIDIEDIKCDIKYFNKFDKVIIPYQDNLNNKLDYYEL